MSDPEDDGRKPVHPLWQIYAEGARDATPDAQKLMLTTQRLLQEIVNQRHFDDLDASIIGLDMNRGIVLVRCTPDVGYLLGTLPSADGSERRPEQAALVTSHDIGWGGNRRVRRNYGPS
jgi:hypothetical protein